MLRLIKEVKMPNNIVIKQLQEMCNVFQNDLSSQYLSTLESERLFCWQSFFVNAGHEELAIDFTKANRNFTEAEIKKLDEFIEGSADNNFKPTRCIKFGCSEEQIARCQGQITKNSKDEPSNSPAYFISDEKLEQYKFLEEFHLLRDEIFEKIAAGDKSAHLGEEFIQSAAKIKANDTAAFNKLKGELLELGAKTTAFTEEVDKILKNMTKKSISDKVESVDLPDKLKPYAQNLDPSIAYVSEDGHIIALIQERDGSYPAQASNFVARIAEVREFDDGLEIQQQFVIDGILNGEKKLSQIVVPAVDFKAMRWVYKNWGNVLITSIPKAQDIVRETIQRTSLNAPVTKVHYTLGWKKIEDTWVYLYSGGAVGGNDVAVAEINELQGYFFKKYPYSTEKCAEMVQKLVDVANHSITIPILAHTFLSVLIEKFKFEEIEPKYLLWVYGVSGSFKTALTVVVLSFFGSFSSPPATFNDTAAAMEKKAYLTKDSLLLVDDFYPSSSQAEARTKAGLANALIRKYGDRITRSRSTSNLTLAKNYLPRGNLMCTSENLLTGYSTNSRMLCIEMLRGDVNPEKLTELQNNKDMLACFMMDFIEYVAENIMNNEAITFKEKFLDYRDKSQNSNHHKRFAEAIACLQIGWETLLDYLKYINFVDEKSHQEYCNEGFQIFMDLAKKQNDLVENDDISDKFMSALKELIDTNQIVPVNKDLPSTLNKGLNICYDDEDFYYFVPQSTYALVADFFLKRGDLLNINEYMLRKMLADKKYLIQSSDGDGHKTTKIKVGLTTMRVLKISKSVMNTF